jgi:hypothetical protein
MVAYNQRSFFRLCLGLLAASLTLGQANADDYWIVGLNYHPKSKDGAYYAVHARPERSAPHVTAAGSWLLETDKNTGLAEPRLVTLASGRSVARANRALQAVHGYILREERIWRHDHSIDAYGPSIEPGPLTVSYFSSTTLSYIVRGTARTQGASRWPIVRGTTLDIESGTFAIVKPCGRHNPFFFNLGRLLTVCDREKLETFRSLWRTEALALEATVPPYKTGEWDEWCRPLTAEYIDHKDYETGKYDRFLFSLYLTPRGLAVHVAFALFRRDEQCILDAESPFIPTVIPWHKLKPLMNPGPLRDELLALR